MHSIKSYSAKQISKVMNHIGTVWQDEWYDRIIRDEKEFQDTWEYIRQNPVKAGLSATPEEYLFFWQISSKVNQSVVGQASVGQASSLPSNHLSRGGQDARTTNHQDNVQLEYDPETTTTMSRGVGKCPNCGSVIENDLIYEQGRLGGMNHQLYAVAYRKGKGNLEFRLPQDIDFDGVQKAKEYLEENLTYWQTIGILPDVQIPYGHQFAERNSLLQQGLDRWDKVFNPRQLLTLVTYVEIINEAKALIQAEYEAEKAEAIAVYLALVLDRCADSNSRLSRWIDQRAMVTMASATHSLNLMWNYPETNGNRRLWDVSASNSNYTNLCNIFSAKPGSAGIPGIEKHEPKSIQIDAASADNLAHIFDKSVDVVIIDPPYYSTIQYAELSDFFYIWMKRTLGDVLPELFWSELTDKDREAVANPSRFRNMGVSPEELADSDYEAKMSLAFAEYYRVLRDDGVMTVQFNHKDSGAWDVLAKSLIEAGL